jgi:hypothetical protein
MVGYLVAIFNNCQKLADANVGQVLFPLFWESPTLGYALDGFLDQTHHGVASGPYNII